MKSDAFAKSQYLAQRRNARKDMFNLLSRLAPCSLRYLCEGYPFEYKQIQTRLDCLVEEAERVKQVLLAAE